MSKYPFKTVASTVTSLSNATFLKEVAKIAPQFKELASKKSKDIFTEAGFSALQQLPTGSDNVSDFYSVALMVGLQFVDYVSFHNPLDDMGIIERFQMSLGEYMQRTQVGRIPNISPAWHDLKDGQSVDMQIVRKPELTQVYWGKKNVAFQNLVTFQNFDLKRGWLTENGIGDIIGAIYKMVDLNRTETEYGLFFEVLNGALNNATYPMQGSQIIKLVEPSAEVADFTADTFSKDELIDLVENTLNISEAIEATPATTMFNAAKYPNDSRGKELVMLVRSGYKAKIRTMLADVYHDENLKIPFDMKVVENFGGLVPYDSTNAELQPVYDALGAMVGYVKKSYTNVSAAVYDETNDKYTVTYGSQGGSTSDVTPISGVDHYVDPNEKVIAVLIQRGAIFELIQNPYTVRTAPFNARGEYQNVFFNQLDNNISYNHFKNLIRIERQQKTA